MTKEKRTTDLCKIMLFTFALLMLCLQMPVAAATPEQETPVAEAVTDVYKRQKYRKTKSSGTVLTK